MVQTIRGEIVKTISVGFSVSLMIIFFYEEEIEKHVMYTFEMEIFFNCIFQKIHKVTSFILFFIFHCASVIVSPLVLLCKEGIQWNQY
ncbi:hypothetical protein V1478_016827 [Vespula squamosa]|uniref:Uncharacterized protein n=1 Tax=Vespula squamosa TaxID=30214 RepID=A0ABD2A0Y3_VESSQ